ncbi:hypothetical protein Poli38472_002617 [Pythium oligandrum]|uniref:Multidrug and toxic compound extrusion protein n=1 Tax=Pythium oligandrum TaxID=41045 RepID=A0A8K1FIC4_PYTOL|nr:hypothetical protein Poli38472_002617 [Pythium oligandrum]|eukprot:TMW63676.1 hypothetical protein Poli38472_002617 [Pythium oligandrum]
MEVSRLAHDAILHELEEPQEIELLKAVEGVEHGAKIIDEDEEQEADDDDEVVVTIDIDRHPISLSTEKTPLLMAGKHLVAVDPDFDLKALAMKLSEEERDAVLLDARTPAMEIVKDESKRLFGMTLPLMVALLLEILPETILSMMVGHTDPEHSTQLLAAFSLTSLFQMLLLAGLLNGLGSALDTVCSQAFGGKRHHEMWMYAQAGAIMFSACLPFMALILMNGKTILIALGQDPAIADIASNLLLINLLAAPFLIIYSIEKSALQAQNIVTPFALSAFASWIVSLPLAYVLGFWTPLGYVGIALSNVINYIVKAGALFPIVVRNQVYRDSWPGWRLREASRLLPKLTRLGVSSVLMVTFQMLGFSCISLLAGLLPDPATMIAANSIFASVLALSFMPLLGICIAGAIRIGNALGAGQARRASLVARVVIGSSVTVSTIAMFVTLAIADPYAHKFTDNQDALREALKLVHQLVPIIPLLGLSFGMQSIFRACGKQWLSAKLNFWFVFVLGVSLGLFIAIKLDTGISGLWYGNFVGMFCLVLVSSIWFLRMSWDEMAHKARLNTHLHVEEPTRAPDAF